MRLSARHRACAAVSLLLSAVAAAESGDRVDPVIFELTPNARFAGTDIRHWRMFTRTGVTFSQDLRMEFAGSNKDVKLEGIGPVESELAVYRGNDPSKWVRGARGFRAVAYRDLYPGVDVEYHMTAGGLKGDFLVNSGADAGKIRFRYVGADIRLEQGRLVGGEIEERIPAVYEVRAAVCRSFVDSFECKSKHLAQHLQCLFV